MCRVPIPHEDSTMVGRWPKAAGPPGSRGAPPQERPRQIPVDTGKSAAGRAPCARAAGDRAPDADPCPHRLQRAPGPPPRSPGGSRAARRRKRTPGGCRGLFNQGSDDLVNMEHIGTYSCWVDFVHFDFWSGRGEQKYPSMGCAISRAPVGIPRAPHYLIW